MPRFELSEPCLEKFWEIAMEGEVLTFRYGDIGSTGRTRSRSHPTEEHARIAYSEAVRRMLDQGYVRVLPPPAGPVSGPSWNALIADPDDPYSLAVHADWLQASGSALGEVVARELAGLDVDYAALAPELANYPGPARPEWRHGFLHALKLGLSRDVDAMSAAHALLSRDYSRLLRHLTVEFESATQVVETLRLPALESLCVSDRSGSRLDLDVLNAATPRLRDLRLRGVRCRGRLPDSLVSVELGEESGAIEQLVSLPDLKRLSLLWAREDWVRLLGAAGVLGRLDHLRLETGEVELAGVLAALKTVRCASTVDVAVERFHVEDARLLAAHPDVRAVRIEGTVESGVAEVFEAADVQILEEPRVEEMEDPVRPGDLAMTWFIYRGVRDYAWAIGRDRRVHHVCSGRVTGPCRWVWHRFPSEDLAEEMLHRRIEEKRREGYVPHRPVMWHDA